MTGRARRRFSRFTHGTTQLEDVVTRTASELVERHGDRIVVTDPALEKAIRLKAEKKKRQSVQDDLLRRVERIEKVLGLDAG